MINKEEVIFNSKSLVSTWLFDAKDFSDLRLIFNHESSSMIVPCTKENCGDKLAEILLNNEAGYTEAKLVGTVNRTQKTFGILDIR